MGNLNKDQAPCSVAGCAWPGCKHNAAPLDPDHRNKIASSDHYPLDTRYQVTPRQHARQIAVFTAAAGVNEHTREAQALRKLTDLGADSYAKLKTIEAISCAKKPQTLTWVQGLPYSPLTYGGICQVQSAKLLLIQEALAGGFKIDG